MQKYRTATMSHEDIRSKIQRALDAKYPPKRTPEGDIENYSNMPWVSDVFDGHFIHKNGPKPGLHKQAYSIDGNDEVQFVGKPQPVRVTKGYELKTSMAFAAKVTAGEDASALLDELIEKNPLMAAIKDSPNTHLVVFDLTSVGRPSHHEGPVQYQLAKKGLTKQALATLITKPIHVTPGFDGHFVAGKDPIAIGVFLGGTGIDNEDGSVTLRAVGTLWDGDFPDIVKEIQEKKADLGASYEIAYLAASASRIGGSVVEIADYEFSGGAILLKSMAAHPETSLLMASKDDSALFEEPGRPLPKFQAQEPAGSK